LKIELLNQKHFLQGFRPPKKPNHYFLTPIRANINNEFKKQST